MLFRRKRSDEKKNRAYEILEKEKTAAVIASSPIIMKETIKETTVVKYYCQYCGGSMDATVDKCPHCGARKKR
jgi:rubrerythrin